HIAFLMIVDDVLGHSLLEVPLAEGNYAIKTFMFDGADEALGGGIRVRRRRSSPPPFASRSQISTRCARSSPSSAVVSVRPTCRMNNSWGRGVDPRMRTRREAKSMTKAV